MLDRRQFIASSDSLWSWKDLSNLVGSSELRARGENIVFVAKLTNKCRSRESRTINIKKAHVR